MMSAFQLNSFDSDDDDSDYVPSDDEEVINQELKTLSDSKVIENVSATVSQPSAVERKARIDTLWKQFLDNESDVTLQKTENTDTKAALKLDSLRQTPKLETTYDAVPCKQSIPKQTSTNKETTCDAVPCTQSTYKQTSKLNVNENFKSERSHCPRTEDKFTILNCNSSSKKRPTGLNSLLGKIQNKKPKITTLQKSITDWESFKKDEGISSDLEIFNRGKSGYLERQAFLMRSDFRSFEVEKSIRMARK